MYQNDLLRLIWIWSRRGAARITARDLEPESHSASGAWGVDLPLAYVHIALRWKVNFQTRTFWVGEMGIRATKIGMNRMWSPGIDFWRQAADDYVSAIKAISGNAFDARHPQTGTAAARMYSADLALLEPAPSQKK